MKILVTTHPFGSINKKSRELLESYNVNYNTLGREYEKQELIELLKISYYL